MNEHSARPSLPIYYNARKALAEAVRIDEVLEIRNQAEAMKAYAHMAQDKEMEAHAVAVRMRATRRLGQLVEQQRQTVGLANGGDATRLARGCRHPKQIRPTLAEVGIDKNLAKEMRPLARMADDEFEQSLEDIKQAIVRAGRNVIRAKIIEEEREAYRAAVRDGGTFTDLEALIASGLRACTMLADVPLGFETYSEKGKQRSPERHYDTMTPDEIMAMGPLVLQLAAKDCALAFWTLPHLMELAFEVMRAWGFEPKTKLFCWVKTNADGTPFMGQGLSGTRSNTEDCCLATRGAPMRLAKNVNQIIMMVRGEHSEKPTEAHRRLERPFPGPRLELFARRPMDGWTVWGNELRKDGDDGRAMAATERAPQPSWKAANGE